MGRLLPIVSTYFLRTRIFTETMSGTYFPRVWVWHLHSHHRDKTHKVLKIKFVVTHLVGKRPELMWLCLGTFLQLSVNIRWSTSYMCMCLYDVMNIHLYITRPSFKGALEKKSLNGPNSPGLQTNYWRS